MQKAADKNRPNKTSGILKKLAMKKGEDEYAYQFSPPTTQEKIKEFEKKYEASLPDSYKSFLLMHNGGFLCSGSWAEYIWETGNTDFPRDRSLVLLSIEEIEEIYSGFIDSINEFLGGYFHPFDMIPFAQACNNDYFVFKNSGINETESAVYDGAPGIGLGSRGVLFSRFIDFLEAYIKNDGYVLTNIQMAEHKADKYKRTLFESVSTNKYDDLYLYRNEKSQEIIDITTEMLRTSPNNSILLGLRAEAYRNTENYKACILDCNKALRKEKEQLWILALRWHAYYLAGNEVQAEIEKKRLAELERKR